MRSLCLYFTLQLSDTTRDKAAVDEILKKANLKVRTQRSVRVTLDVVLLNSLL